MIRQFVSYPKSGRTWLRFMLSCLGLEKQIHFHHDRFEFNDGNAPPHDFRIKPRLAAYAEIDKLVYLERDPRDVMVSLYYQVTGRFQDFFHYEGGISEFIRDDYFGAENLKKYRMMWADLTQHCDFLKVTYEQCHADTRGTLDRVLAYYDFDVDARRVSEAVAQGAFENMKQLEASETFSEPWLRPRNSKPKVRSGKVGAYREALDPKDIAYLDIVFEILESNAPDD